MQLIINNRPLTAKETEWQGRVALAHHEVGRVLTEMDELKDGKLPYETAGFKSIHEYAKALLNIDKQTVAHTLVSYKKLEAYKDIATPTEIALLNKCSQAMFTAIPKDIDPHLAIEVLTTATTAKGVKETLSQLAELSIQAEEKLKLQQQELAKEQDKANKEAKERKLKQDELAKERKLKQDELDKEHDKLLAKWKLDNATEYTNIRKANSPQQIEIGDLIFDIDNDLFKPTNPKLVKALKYCKEYDLLDTVADLTDDEIIQTVSDLKLQYDLMKQLIVVAKRLDTISKLGKFHSILDDDYLVSIQ